MNYFNDTATEVVQPVIIAGGSGVRLWPVSRKAFPKQFLKIIGSQSLFQVSLNRSRLFNGASKPPIIVANQQYEFLIYEQLNEIGISDFSLVLEPFSRNTAPAITLAALQAIELGEDPALLIFPADHVIEDEKALENALAAAIDEAMKGAIVTLGISPSSAHTDYGYIKIEGNEVQKFIEKPNKESAEKYFKDKNYFWNSGLLITKPSAWLKALEKFRPDILHSTAEAWKNSKIVENTIRLEPKFFKKIQGESADYAVIEHLPKSAYDIRMIPLNAGWSDLGSWTSVWTATPKDNKGNALVGNVVVVDTTNSYVSSESRLVAVVGLDNIVVADTPDAVLIASQASSTSMKKMAQKLEKIESKELISHRKVKRPWGWYDIIDEDNGFKVKRIHVNPGGLLSLQKHKHRSEHWVVVRGTGEVTCGDKVFLLNENQSTYIPRGEIHRLANQTDAPLEIIETQFGEYLGEDDIIRIEDIYNR